MIFLDSPLHAELQSNPLVTIHPLSPAPSLLASLQKSGLPFLIIGPLKVLYQVFTITKTLGYSAPPSKFLLVQNPPAVPTLALAILVCFFRNTQLVTDWHNYGYTILSGTKGENHPLVKVSKVYEQFLGRFASYNFTVTDAMARQLKAEPFNITSPILTLHDRPAAIFQPIGSQEARRGFLERCEETRDFTSSIMDGSTKLLVSSTSWTPDEDFSILLDALVSYSTTFSSPKSELPPLLVIVTGKGPDKSKYIARIKSLKDERKLEGITIGTPWLSMQHYALLLASADLGVCLHKSSSGVDLPMKVVDMFGTGLPVVGYSDYESWPELVREGDNGMGFEDADQLKELLKKLFGPAGAAALGILGKGAMKEGSRRWDDEWDSVAGRMLGLCE